MPGQSPDILHPGVASERLGEASGRPRAPVRPDRNLALELVRVTESAAMAAGRWVGRGDKVAAEAVERRGPQGVPNYAIRVADDFHRFYHHHRVLESDAQAFRLGLCRATQSVIARCFDLVGVDAPERM